MSGPRHWEFNKDYVAAFLRGHDKYRFACSVIPPRAPEADILGAALRYGVKPTDLDFRNWLSEFIPTPELQLKTSFDLHCLHTLEPSQAVMKGADFSLQDSPESDWGRYLLSLKESGFRGRFFDLPEHQCLLYTHPIPSSYVKAYSGGRYSYPSSSWKFSFFRAVDLNLNRDLPESHRYTEASHIAALFNCQELIDALSEDSNEALLKQDQSNFYEVLAGLTALHYAVLGLHKKILTYLLQDRRLDLMTLDRNGNTLLHVLACLKDSPVKQVDFFQAIVKLVFKLEPDAEKREKFYQHKNKANKTALELAASAENKELVQRLIFIPGVNILTVDLKALGIDYGTKLNQELAVVREYVMAVDESARSLREEAAIEREGMRGAIQAMAIELDDARRERGLLADELEHSRQERLMLMQMMTQLCGNLESRRLISPMPFLAVLRDREAANAGAAALDPVLNNPMGVRK